MRDADVPYEIVEEYCRAILNAQSVEELEIIKEEIPITLENAGLDEITIQNFFTEANMLIEMGEEGKLAFDENGKIDRTQTFTQITREQMKAISEYNAKQHGLEKEGTGYVLFNEGENISDKQNHTEINTEVSTPEIIPENILNNQNPGKIELFSGIAISTLVIVLAFKQKLLKKKNLNQNNGLKR